MAKDRRRPVKVDLDSEGVRKLVRLTNSQFEFWRETLKSHAVGDLPEGDLLHYWFLLTALVQRGGGFEMPRKELRGAIPRIQDNRTRYWIGKAKENQFIDGWERGNAKLFKLSETGKAAVAATLARWIEEFSTIQKEHFAPPARPAKK